jgi:hypothetical protein
MREAECTCGLGHQKEGPWSEVTVTREGGITPSSFLRGSDHGIVRFEVLWDVGVLEITGEAPDFLPTATMDDNVPVIIFAVNIIIWYMSSLCD